MRKQIFWPIGTKRHSEVLIASLGLLRNQNFSHKCKKFYQGIPLPYSIIQSSNQIPEKASWDIQHFVNNLFLDHWFSKGFVAMKPLEWKLWKPKVKMKLLWMKQDWGSWHLPQASTTIVTPKKTSLQHLEFFRTVWNHCRRQQYVELEWHSDLYLYPTVYVQLVLNILMNTYYGQTQKSARRRAHLCSPE